jgi:hypothetical protein
MIMTTIASRLVTINAPMRIIDAGTGPVRRL